MKQNKWIDMRALAIALAALVLGSCTTDFEYINKDKDKIPSGDLNKDNLTAAYIQSMQLSVFPEDNNAYQRMDDLCGNIFAGYVGGTNTWNSNKNSTSYYFDVTVKWHDVAFEAVYGSMYEGEPPVPGVMNSWNTIRQKSDSSSIVFAIGEVVKVMGMHRVCDMYGPLPYLNYGKTLYTPYDSQKDIYNRFFTELDHAIDVMSIYRTQNPSAMPIAKFDLIYGSDILKWIKFANSLKLRLAMRIRYIDPVNAKKYAEEAVNHQYGVIEDNTGTAILKSSSLYAFVHPYPMIVNNYNDSRMGASIESYLSGYSDPRLAAYFTPATDGKYHGVRLGVTNGTSYQTNTSKSTLGTDAIAGVSNGMHWMNAAEVCFLRAEGAMLGWDMNGTTEVLYNKGIELSMSLWGISGNRVSSYMNNTVAKPADFKDVSKTAHNATAPSTITVKWEDAATTEKKLERIITQKWLALYPNGQEAWSEFRRTGYPKIFPVVTNKSDGKIAEGQFIKRIPLPTSEHLNNSERVQTAVSTFLAGDDSQGQRLWWDAK